MKDTNPHARPIQINGVDYVLKLGPKALRLAKEKGVGIPARMLANPDLDELVRLTWVGLLPDTPNLKEDDLIEALEESGDMLAVISVTSEQLGRLTEGKKPGKGKGKP